MPLLLPAATDAAVSVGAAAAAVAAAVVAGAALAGGALELVPPDTTFPWSSMTVTDAKSWID